jgi:hypothetical protein
MPAEHLRDADRPRRAVCRPPGPRSQGRGDSTRRSAAAARRGCPRCPAARRRRGRAPRRASPVARASAGRAPDAAAGRWHGVAQWQRSTPRARRPHARVAPRARRRPPSRPPQRHRRRPVPRRRRPSTGAAARTSRCTLSHGSHADDPQALTDGAPARQERRPRRSPEAVMEPSSHDLFRCHRVVLLPSLVLLPSRRTTGRDIDTVVTIVAASRSPATDMYAPPAGGGGHAEPRLAESRRFSRRTREGSHPWPPDPSRSR